VTASREFKGGLLGNLKAQLDTSHKKSFRVSWLQDPHCKQ
jgi:hypothetical protein